MRDHQEPASDGPGAVVFDLDGTLIDTAPGIALSLNGLLVEAGRRPVTVAEVRRFIGDGVVRLVERAFAATGQPLAAARARAVGDALSARMEAAPPTPADLFDGVAAALAGLRTRGWRLGVCTNKPVEAARQALAATGLAPLIDGLIGGGSLAARKPAAEPLLAVLAALGAPAAQTVYVGDSEVDGETAAAAAVPFILVTYGYRRGPADAIPAARRIDRFADLDRALATLDGAAIGRS